MRYDPVMAALVRERGPSHPDYYSVLLQEKIIALALEGRVDVRQPRPALLTQVRNAIRQEREAMAAGAPPACSPSVRIAASIEQAHHAMKENPVERILAELAGGSGTGASLDMKFKRRQTGRSSDPAIVLDEICREHRVGRRDLLGPSRRQDWAMARFALFYRLRSETRLSYKAIGEVAGGRHHATVLHGIREWCRINGLPHPDRCAVHPKAA